MALAPELQALVDEHELVDPKTFEVLVASEDGEWLEARQSGRRFPIANGIPKLIEASVEPLSPS